MSTSTTTTTTTTDPAADSDSGYVYFNYDGARHARPILPPASDKPGFTSIPLVDISGIFSPSLSDRQRVADEVRSACENVGFVYVTGHGVDERLLDDLWKAQKEYFGRSTEEKMKEWIYRSPNLRGYEPVYGAAVDESFKLGDKNETFLCGYDPTYDPTHPSLSQAQLAQLLQNQWPSSSSLPNFKHTLLTYHAHMLTLSRALMRTFALALSLPETYFDRSCTAPTTPLKLLHYPPQSPSSTADGTETGIGAHTDFVHFTLLAQTAPGLEVLNAHSQWVPAPPKPGTLVLNVGDLLMRMSNDRLLSTVHRVRNVQGGDRWSAAFFFAMDMDAPVEVLPNCHSETEPPKYPTETVGEVFRRRHATKIRKFEARERAKGRIVPWAKDEGRTGVQE